MAQQSFLVISGVNTTEVNVTIPTSLNPLCLNIDGQSICAGNTASVSLPAYNALYVYSASESLSGIEIASDYAVAVEQSCAEANPDNDADPKDFMIEAIPPIEYWDKEFVVPLLEEEGENYVAVVGRY